LIRDSLSQIVASAVASLVESGQLPRDVLDAPVEISDTKQPEHGDFACNFALVASKKAGMNPRQLGEALREALRVGRGALGENPFDEIEVAGPGFLNFRLNPAWQASFIHKVLELGESLPNAQVPRPNAKAINVEFVSVNPNGPITIGSGRGAAYGSTLCNVLAAAGNIVHREYYINDGVNSEQMSKFAESVRCLALGQPVPDNGYKGDYVHDVAKHLVDKHGQETVRGKAGEFGNLAWFQHESEDEMLIAQRSALTAFDVEFDTWFSEQSLHNSGAVAAEIAKMIASGVADEREVRTVLKMARGGVIEEVLLEDQAGKAEVDDEVHAELPSPTPSPSSAESSSHGEGQRTLWLRSTKFGDDMDRVLRRRDGRLTYIASDVSYHKDKLTDESGTRGTGPVDKMITILGPDHHGYIGRLQAVVAAMLVAEGSTPHPNPSPRKQGEGLSEIDAKIYSSPEERDTCRTALAEAKQKLEVQIYQLVRFMKDGKPAPMRKRDGNIYALIDLMREIGEKVKPEGSEEEKLEAGKDVARFFYLMRSHDTTFDFDLDLAEKQSDENPVFYVQYAHARICSVIGKAAESGIPARGHDGGPERSLEEPDPTLLTHNKELALIRKICDLPFEVARCAEDYGVHRLTTYAIELARTYHHFYDACRVIQPDEMELSRVRLALCEATRIALKSTLDLLGVSSPQRMDRVAPPETAG
jgi:arginyl-tRNA synthetase